MIINMSGGGSGKVFAVIGATYPAGSVCTCSNGSKTLKAKDTSGTALFSIPSAGEWTVTSTSADGSKTKSTSISIAAEGQIESVTLTYEMIIYKPGDTKSGWSMRNDAGTVTFGKNNLKIDTSYNMGGYTRTNLRYNTPIIGGTLSTLTVVASEVTGYNSEIGVVAEANKDTYTADNPTFVANISMSKASTATLDLSTLTSGAKYYLVTNSYGRNLTSDEVVHPSSITITSIIAT